MQRIAITLLVCATLVLAQSRTIVTPLTPGVTMNGLILNSGISPNDVAPVLYSIYIPENATVINFMLTNNNNDNCDFIDLLVETQNPPCVQETFEIDTFYTYCNFFSSDESDFDSAFLQMEPGTSSSWFVQNVDTTIFVGVATGDSYAGESCTYSLTVSFNFTCPSGSIGIRNESNDNDAGCIFYHPVSNPANYSVFVNVNQTEDYFDEWRFPIAANTGDFHIHIDSSVYMNAYGRQNGGASADAYDCSASSDSNMDSSYTLDLHCYVPESGWLYLFVESENTQFNFTMSSSVMVCGSTSVGFNCSFPAVAITDFSQVYNVRFSEQDGWLSYNFRYFYFDAPASLNTSNLQLNVMLTNTTGEDEGYVIVTKDNFPEANSYRDGSYQYGILNDDDNEDTTFTFLYTFYDNYFWSRNWIGLYCYDNTCNITLWFTTPGTTTTTTSTTAAAATTTTTAAAATTTTTAAAAATTTTTAAAATTTTSTSTTAAAATTTTSTTAAAATTTTTTAAAATSTTTTSTSTSAAAATTTTTTSSSAAASGPLTTLLFTTNDATPMVASLLVIIAAALF